MTLIAHIDDEPAIVEATMEIGARVYAILRACYRGLRSEAYLAIKDERERDQHLRAIVRALGETEEDYLDLASQARTTPIDSWAVLENDKRPVVGFTSYDAFAAHGEAPRLILLDLHLDPSGAESGLSALRSIKQRFPNVPVVVFSQHSWDDQISACYRAGANEYQFKGGAQFERVLVGILSHWLRSPSLRAGGSSLAPEPGSQTSASDLASYRGAPDDLSPAIPGELIEAVASGDGVLVLGPGVSAFSGVPTGRALILHLIEHFARSLPEPLASIPGSASAAAELDIVVQQLGSLSKVMDAVAAAVPRAALVTVLGAAFGGAAPGNALLTALIRCPWQAVISLTWDNLAEVAFAGEQMQGLPPMRVATVNDTLELPSAARSGERLLYKPYGVLERAPTLALTSEEMRRLVQRAPAFQRALAGLFQSGTFFFVGSGLDGIEQFLQAITPEFDAGGTRHFALVPHDPTNALRLASLARFGVRLLEFDLAASPASILTMVRRLRDSVRTAAPSQTLNERTASFFLSRERIHRVRLEQIGPFDLLDLDLNSDIADSFSAAPWSVIFGANGTGKSTILRAIALVLAGDHPAAAAAGTRLLRAGAPEGLVEVQIGDQILKTRLTRDLSHVLVSSLQQTPLGSGNALVLGFPALRGARTVDPVGPSPVPEVRDPDPLDLLALIAGEIDSRLSDFKQWLVNTLTLAGQGNARAVTMRKLLDDVIRDLVPGQVDALAPFTDGDFTIRVMTPEGIIPFDDLSQGMTSIFNWVGILTQRLFSICEDSANPALEPAIVLIDEVDAHLHPEWQRRLVTLTRHFFPNVQIIATSHSPLLAGSLHAREAVVLVRDPETRAVVRLTHIGDPFGLPSQDILTSGLFNMVTDRNLEVEHLILVYFSIFQKVQRSQEEEELLRVLEQQLRYFRYGGPDLPLPELPALTSADMERLGWEVSHVLGGGTP